MDVQVKLFGPQAVLAEARVVTVRVGDGATGRDLRRALAQAVPALAQSLPGSRLAINHAYAADDQVVTAADEVALIGMVSGG